VSLTFSEFGWPGFLFTAHICVW